MRRLLVVLGVFALVVVSCDGEGSGQTRVGSAETSTIGSNSDDATTSPTTVTATGSDRPQAPDFTLELGDGGRYTLSEGEKPVYLVFWAEW